MKMLGEQSSGQSLIVNVGVGLFSGTGTHTCVVPGFLVRCSTNCAIPRPDESLFSLSI